MFIDEKNYIKAKIYYKIQKANSIQVETSLDKILEDKRPLYKEVNIELKPMTWKASNDLMRESRTKNMQSGTYDIDWITYNEKKIKMILHSWDIKNEAGKDVPINESTIGSMHPSVAQAILSIYDNNEYVEE